VKADFDVSLVTWIATLGDRHELTVNSGSIVAAYVPVGSEPGTTAMLEVLREGGFRVLLPRVAPGPPAPLLWSYYDGPESLRPGRFGLLEPIAEPSAAATIDAAALVLVPALAVDRQGVRLGRGAGYYDRSIRTLSTRQLVAVVYDHELVDALPADEYDVPMGWSLTPTGGYTKLGTS
jgi:5-formyltetrahydrofolate cyclo-ligase